MQGGGGSRGVGEIFVGSASSVSILLGRTSEIKSPKNKYARMHFFILDAWGGGGIPQCRGGGGAM